MLFEALSQLEAYPSNKSRETSTNYTEVLVPPADLSERGPHLHRCGMLRELHAVLAFDEGRREKGCNF
jgi:hypothetical protein